MNGSAGGDSADESADVTLGTLLREARLSRGVTLADVERDTRINRSYLDALENDRFDVLPAPVFARGFVRSYARYLGLDQDEVMSLVPRDLPRPAGLEPLPGLRRGAATAMPALNWPVVLVAVAVVGGALLLGLWLWGARGGDGVTPPAPPAPTAEAGGTATATPAAPPAAVPPFAENEMPNFVGVDRETATALLNDLGLTFVVIERASGDVPAGRVLQQAPASGSSVRAGDSVTLFVSSGPDPAP